MISYFLPPKKIQIDRAAQKQPYLDICHHFKDWVRYSCEKGVDHDDDDNDNNDDEDDDDGCSGYSA